MNKRICPALKKYLSYLFFVLAVNIVTHTAFAQGRSGSLMVLYRADDKAIVGADSLLTEPSSNGAVYHEYNCKIVALGDYMIFASTGYYGNGEMFVFNEAKTTYSRMKTGALGEIAKGWGESVVRYLTTHDVGPNSEIRRLAIENNGIPTHAIFVDARPMSPFTVIRVHIDYAITNRSISYGIDLVPSHGIGSCITPVGPYCSGGETNSFNELVNVRIPHGNPEIGRLDENRPPLIDHDAWRTKKLTELAIAKDRTGHIGGKVDVAILRPGEKTQWISSPNCHPQTAKHKKKKK